MFCLLFSPLLLGPPSPLHARLAFGFCLLFKTIWSQFFFFVKFSQKSLSHPYTLRSHSFLIYLLFVILILFWVLILYFNISMTFQFYFLIWEFFTLHFYHTHPSPLFLCLLLRWILCPLFFRCWSPVSLVHVSDSLTSGFCFG